MTESEWHAYALGRLDDWLSRRWDPARKPLFEHMGMSPQSFMQWRETGIIPKETRILWVIFDDAVFERLWGTQTV